MRSSIFNNDASTRLTSARSKAPLKKSKSSSPYISSPNTPNLDKTSSVTSNSQNGESQSKLRNLSWNLDDLISSYQEKGFLPPILSPTLPDGKIEVNPMDNTRAIKSPTPNYASRKLVLGSEEDESDETSKKGLVKSGGRPSSKTANKAPKYEDTNGDSGEDDNIPLSLLSPTLPSYFESSQGSQKEHLEVKKPKPSTAPTVKWINKIDSNRPKFLLRISFRDKAVFKNALVLKRSKSSTQSDGSPALAGLGISTNDSNDKTKKKDSQHDKEKEREREREKEVEKEKEREKERVREREKERAAERERVREQEKKDSQEKDLRRIREAKEKEREKEFALRLKRQDEKEREFKEMVSAKDKERDLKEKEREESSKMKQAQEREIRLKEKKSSESRERELEKIRKEKEAIERNLKESEKKLADAEKSLQSKEMELSKRSSKPSSSELTYEQQKKREQIKQLNKDVILKEQSHPPEKRTKLPISSSLPAIPPVHHKWTPSQREETKHKLQSKKTHWLGLAKAATQRAETHRGVHDVLHIIIMVDSLIMRMISYDFDERSKLVNDILPSERSWKSLVQDISQLIEGIDKLTRTLKDKNSLEFLKILVCILFQTQAVILKRINSILTKVIQSYINKNNAAGELNGKIIELQQLTINNNSLIIENFMNSKPNYLNAIIPIKFPITWFKKTLELEVAQQDHILDNCHNNIKPSNQLYYLPMGVYSNMNEITCFLYNILHEFIDIFNKFIRPNEPIKYVLQSGQ